MSMGLESLPKKQAYIFSFPHWNIVRNWYENYESGLLKLVRKNFLNCVNISRSKFTSLAIKPASNLFKCFIIWALLMKRLKIDYFMRLKNNTVCPRKISKLLILLMKELKYSILYNLMFLNLIEFCPRSLNMHYRWSLDKYWAQ